ncbi:MAG TPA: nuclear transport factor 2 family protein [Actinomycetota bacterium]
MPSPEQITTAVDAYARSFGAGDKELFLSALSDGVTQIDPVGSTPNHGKEALAAFWDGLFELCDTVALEARDVFVAGDEAAMLFTVVQGRKDGQQLTFEGVDVFQVDDDGKIVLIKGFGRLRQG